MPRHFKEEAWMIGTDNVVSWYRNMAPAGVPYYSVWAKRQLKFSYDGLTLEGGEKMLRDNLEPAEEAGMNQVLTLRLHKGNEQRLTITDKSPYWASMDFKLCEGDEWEPMADFKHIGSTSEIETLRARITALESEQGGGSGIMGAVNEFLRSDHLQPVFAQAIAGILGKIAPGIMGSPQMPQAGPRMAPAVNGLSDDGVVSEGLYEAICTLERADPNLEQDLTILAMIAVDNPAMFQMLLTQLRSYAKTGKNTGL